MSDDQSEWVLNGKLVNKYLFITGKITSKGHPQVLLSLRFLNTDGELIECKTWRGAKAIFLYRTLEIDTIYKVVGSGAFEKPPHEFNAAKLCTQDNYRARWWIQPRDDIEIDKTVRCFTNFERAIKVMRQDQAVDLHLTFVSKTRGPPKFFGRGRTMVQGYYVKVMDDEGCVKTILVWHVVRYDKNFLNCRPGDTLLICSARFNTIPNCQNIASTVVAPVVESDCVYWKRTQELKFKFQETYGD